MRRAGIIEGAVLGGLCLLWVLVINAGSENGIGYFHQPRPDLLVPLIHGALYNAATFWVHGFVLVPRYLMRRRLSPYTLGVLALSAGVICGKTAGEKLIISLDMPDLAEIGLLALALENLWMLLAFLSLSAIYGVTRFALRRSARVSHLQREKAATELTLLHTLQSGARSKGGDRVIDFISGKKVYRTRVEDILYLEGRGNYVKVVCRDRSFMVYTSLYRVEERLPAVEFLRVHRSYIVALKHIDAASRTAVTVRGRTLRVGPKYAASFALRLGLDRQKQRSARDATQ